MIGAIQFTPSERPETATGFVGDGNRDRSGGTWAASLDLFRVQVQETHLRPDGAVNRFHRQLGSQPPNIARQEVLEISMRFVDPLRR